MPPHADPILTALVLTIYALYAGAKGGPITTMVRIALFIKRSLFQRRLPLDPRTAVQRHWKEQDERWLRELQHMDKEQRQREEYARWWRSMWGEKLLRAAER
ncbi:hypothetical protein BFW01_g8937 [Lasiodiplodia theobromae]|nr:hypothetical protein BFW01_g8937 [Lasiodiplodia theobromae]